MDAHTRLRHPQNVLLHAKAKEDESENATPFLNKMKTIQKSVKIIRYGNAGKNKTLEENCEIVLKIIISDLCHQALHRKM